MSRLDHYRYPGGDYPTEDEEREVTYERGRSVGAEEERVNAAALLRQQADRFDADTKSVLLCQAERERAATKSRALRAMVTRIEHDDRAEEA